jgi:hypothetical protein
MNWERTRVTDDLNDDLDELSVGLSEDTEDTLADDPLVRELRKTQAAIRTESDERQRAIEAETQERKKDSRRNVLVVLAALLWGTTGVVFGFVAFNSAADVRDTQRQQDRDRITGREAVCVGQNDNLEKIVNVSRSLLAATQRSETDEPRTPEELAQRDAALKVFLETQGFRYVEGKIHAAFLDCELYKVDPQQSEAQRVFKEHP